MNVHAVWQCTQHMDPNQALAVWYKLFMDVVNRHAPIRHKRVKHWELPPWLNKNIIQAMSDRDRLKKERMLTQYKRAQSKKKKKKKKHTNKQTGKKKRKKKRKQNWVEMQRNHIAVNLWKTAKIYHQFGALWMLSPKEPTLDRKKFRIISQLTTFCPQLITRLTW